MELDLSPTVHSPCVCVGGGDRWITIREVEQYIPRCNFTMYYMHISSSQAPWTPCMAMAWHVDWGQRGWLARLMSERVGGDSVLVAFIDSESVAIATLWWILTPIESQ